MVRSVGATDGLLWEVVRDTPGLKVRQGCDLSSPLLRERLAGRALVRQRALVGERLHYEVVKGSGPPEGWISVSSGSKQLLARVPYDPGVAGAAAGQRVVGCLGDSITKGGYPKLLQRLLPDWKVCDFGVGHTMASRPSSCQYTATARFREALTSGADAFVVCFGTNDASTADWDEPAYVEGVGNIVAALRSAPAPPAAVLLMTPPPLYPGSERAVERSRPALNEDIPKAVLPRLARELGAIFVDVFTPMGGPRLTRRGLLSWDGIHPCEEGHAVIAGVVRDALTAAFTGPGRNEIPEVQGTSVGSER